MVVLDIDGSQMPGMICFTCGALAPLSALLVPWWRECGLTVVQGPHLCGWLQVLPFASEETLAQLEQNIAASGSVTDMLHGGATAHDITERLLRGLGVSDASFSLQPRLSGLPTRLALLHPDQLIPCGLVTIAYPAG